MTKWLPWVGGALVGFLLLAMPQCAAPSGGWEADSAAVMAGVRAREAQADAALKRAHDLENAANGRIAVANRTVQRATSAIASANSLRDSVLALGLAPDTCLPWVGLLRREADSLRSALRLDSLALDTLRAAVVDLKTANAALAASDSLHAASVDSLEALVRRVPSRKWWVPQVTAGYGAVVSGGAIRTGPGVQVGFRLRF